MILNKDWFFDHSLAIGIYFMYPNTLFFFYLVQLSFKKMFKDVSTEKNK